MQQLYFQSFDIKKLFTYFIFFITTNNLIALQIEGFLSAGGGVIFDAPKLPRHENMIYDPDSTNHNLNTVSEYHKTISPEIYNLSSRFNAHRDNKVGLKLFGQLNDEVSITTYMLAKGYDSHFDVETKWGFVSWEPNSHFQVRIGRLAIPLCMFSQSLEASHFYPWIRLPMEMYSGVPVDSWSGADISYKGYRGSWDYQLIASMGTVDQNIWIGNTEAELIARNGVSFSSEIGNEYLKMRFGASRVDAKYYSDPGIESIDLVLNSVGDYYSSWLANKFNGGGTVTAVDMDMWTSNLGMITSKSTEVLSELIPVDWANVIDELNTSDNLSFLQSATASRLAGSISYGLYGELTNFSNILINAFTEYKDHESTLDDLKALGAGMADENPTVRDQIQSDIPSSFFSYDLNILLQKYAEGTDYLGMNSESNDFKNYASLIQSLGASGTSLGNDAELSAVITEAHYLATLAPSSVDRSNTVNEYVANDTSLELSDKSLNAANAIYGVVSAFGATENPERFNALASLINLSGADTASNYGLLQKALKEVVNETYLMELRRYLYKDFSQQWKAGSFLSAGYTYDYDNWYSTAEYGFRHLPGYVSDAQGWYLTIGRRFGSFMPHITYAGLNIKDPHIRMVSDDLSQGADINITNNWRDMLNNVQNESNSISGITYENMMYDLSQIQDFWHYNQAYSQNSINVGLRYDWKPGMCFKVEVQHIRPKLGSKGFFDPWDLDNKMTGNIIALSMDMVF